MTCVMPTRDRRDFATQAIWYFLAQRYPHKELVILDDGAVSVEDVVPDDERIRHIRLDRRMSLGEKRNLGCELARGSLIAHWDDDDWMSPERLSVQVAELVAADADACGIADLLYYRLDAGDVWLRRLAAGNDPPVAGGTLLYRRTAWEPNLFPAVDLAEEISFVRKLRPDRIRAIRGSQLYVAVLHRTNAAAQNLADQGWEAQPADVLAATLGADTSFYARLRNGGQTSAARPTSTSERVTVASFFRPWDGYGLMAEYLALGLVRAGASVDVYVLESDPNGQSDDFKRLPVVAAHAVEGPAVWFAPPERASERLSRASDLFVNTMWESSRLPSQWIEPLSRARGVVVPTRFCAGLVRDTGITVPLEVVAEGVDPALYSFVDRPARDGITTLMVATIGRRKHIEEGVEAWRRAFRNDSRARLIVKGKLGIGADYDDPRIQVISETESTRGIIHWYRQADVLLALGNEGFGLPLVEAMATGLPVVALDSEGQHDVCVDAPDLTLPVPAARWEACDDSPWGSAGVRGVPDVSAVARRLRWVDKHRDEARELGCAASAWALRHRNVWDKAPVVLDFMERHACGRRPLRRLPAIWRASTGSSVHAYVSALSAELGGVRIADEPPALGGLRVLHVQHDVRSETVVDMAQRVLEAKLGSVPVVITEHAVNGQAQAWERDADVLVTATEAGAVRLRARWPDRRVEMIPYGCPPVAATPKRAPGRVLAVLGTLEEPGPWRALELVRELDHASVLVVAPRARAELELAWAEAVGGLRVERVGERLDPVAAARRIASTADVAAFWDDEDAPLAASLDIRAVLAAGVAVVTAPSERFADVREATAQAVDVGEGVAALLSDPRAAAAVGERARAFCRAHSWRTVAQRHLDLWKSFEAS